MSSSNYQRVQKSYFTRSTGILLLLMIIGLIAAAYRFANGLGAATNLSNQYPWGIWIAFDILCGVALAAGGFVTAAVVYIFGGKKYHALVRPAILTAFLGYLFVAIALLADLGLPWNIWHPIIYWPEHSAMFEVAWCVMLYLSVLALEFMPAVFERFGWKVAHANWQKIVPVYVVLALSFFTYIMSHNLVYAIISLVVLGILAVVLPGSVKSRPGVPVLLIMAGIIFSTAHQSSLGSLFLLMPDKLSKLWYSPMLPVNFFLSATAVGFSMVILEAISAAKGFGRPIEKEPLAGMAKICAGLLWLYLIVRIIDVGIQGGFSVMSGSHGTLFAIEIIIGVVLPALLLSTPGLQHKTNLMLWGAILAIFGLVFNRFNVALGGMSMTVVGESSGAYFPSAQEFLVTIGIVAAVVFFYNIAVKAFPIFENPEGGSMPAQAPSTPEKT